MLVNEAQRRIERAKIERLPILNLTELQLPSLPAEIVELPWLIGLFASFNAISDLNPLANLTKLERLDLRGNRVVDLHPISTLTCLTYLDVAGNQLSDVAPLHNLTRLETLYLGENLFADARPLGVLNHLGTLDMSRNQLVDVDACKNLRELQTLDISENRIFDLSPLSELSKLSHLDISSNSIADLSPLKDLSLLKALYFGDNSIRDLTPIGRLLTTSLTINSASSRKPRPERNPLTIPPPEIVSRGRQAIRNYFADLETQGSAELYEAKLLIVGEGGAGKTSLARKLENSTNSLPKESESTMGIDVRRLHIMDVVPGKPFLLNIWDFGGQEIYHSTHQFFLTHRSLYILVDDTRKDAKAVHDEVFAYWLEVVQLLSDNSPLLIIQNEKSDRSKQIDMQGMQARFGFIKECLQTNLATNRGLANVERAVKYWLMRLEHVGETLPNAWIKIRSALGELSRTTPHISLSHYLSLCAGHGVTDERKALRLSEYLHDLGAFLHFQDHIVLKNLIVLQGSWATGAVYALLDDETIKSRSGFFTQGDLDRLWASDAYRAHHHNLMALVEKFELCYRLFDQQEPTWLAPQLLSLLGPIGAWSEDGCLIVRYNYDFMPKGILARLIVRLNRYITDPRIAWRAGMILDRRQTRALVTETYAKREIVIQVKGEQPRELMTIVTEEIDRINDTYKFVRVEKMIPCNCRKCTISEIRHYYNYDALQERIRRGKTNVECEQSYDDVNVRSLLDGVFASIPNKKLEEMKMVISYSRRDDQYRSELQAHLSTLRILHNVEVWDDSQIPPGSNWHDVIMEEIRTADVILFLISSDFLASRYIWEHELPVAIERNGRGEAVAIPIFIRDCDTEGTRFMELQGLPRSGKPVSSYADRDRAYAEIAKDLRRRILQMPKL